MRSERNQDQAIKRDAGKLDYTLLPIAVWTMRLSRQDLEGIIRVREFATRTKYSDRDSWRLVSADRLRAAAERHRAAIVDGEVLDPESGLPHRYHYLTTIAFLVSKGIES